MGDGEICGRLERNLVASDFFTVIKYRNRFPNSRYTKTTLRSMDSLERIYPMKPNLFALDSMTVLNTQMEVEAVTGNFFRSKSMPFV